MKETRIKVSNLEKKSFKIDTSESKNEKFACYSTNDLWPAHLGHLKKILSPYQYQRCMVFGLALYADKILNEFTKCIKKTFVCLFVCNRGDTHECQDGLQTRKLCQSPIANFLV